MTGNQCDAKRWKKQKIICPPSSGVDIIIFRKQKIYLSHRRFEYEHNPPPEVLFQMCKCTGNCDWCTHKICRVQKCVRQVHLMLRYSVWEYSIHDSYCILTHEVAQPYPLTKDPAKYQFPIYFGLNRFSYTDWAEFFLHHPA